MGTKGCRLTMQLSLAGRFLVYVPYGEGIGVSKRLDDEERSRLRKICKSLDIGQGGLIVRTQAAGVTAREAETWQPPGRRETLRWRAPSQWRGAALARLGRLAIRCKGRDAHYRLLVRAPRLQRDLT